MISRKRAEQSFTQTVKEILPAGEEFEVDITGGCFYVFTSELNTLRLWKKYHGSKDQTTQGYSENLKTWFFGLETTLVITED